jgi:hypothetical protein
VRTQGLFGVLAKGQALPKPGAVTVCFGPPVRLQPSATYEEATRIIEQAVRDLRPPGATR